MSNTRHAPEGSPLKQNRFASATEYAENRGILGHAVTAKAALYTDQRKRSLLFFLQALSLKEGGIQKNIQEPLLAMFPERLGTPTMHKLGIAAGQVYSESDVIVIAAELNPSRRFSGEDLLDDGDRLRASQSDAYLYSERTPRSMRTAEYFLAECRERASHLNEFIILLCIDPRLSLEMPGEGSEASVPYFRDIVGALLEFQRRYTAQVKSKFLLTSLAAPMMEALDYGLEFKRIVIIQAESDRGKSSSADAWHEMHLGESRLIRLVGITTRTNFFRTLARSCGRACTYALSSARVQARVEDYLQRSQLMLIIDEGHYLFAGDKRIYARPELIDWLDTAVFNYGVPAAILATPQLEHRRRETERQVGWNFAQLARRVGRYLILNELPTVEDLSGLAQKLIPDASKATVSLLVAYAIGAKKYFSGIVDAVNDARVVARKRGHAKISFEDLEEAIKLYRTPTDLAQQAAFGPKPPQRGTRRIAQDASESLDRYSDSAGTPKRVSEPLATRLRGTPVNGHTPVLEPATARGDEDPRGLHVTPEFRSL